MDIFVGIVIYLILAATITGIILREKWKEKHWHGKGKEADDNDLGVTGGIGANWR